jgi:tetratricopeptide (TPR) repeat protein
VSLRKDPLPEDAQLLEVADAVLDGTSVDWVAVEASQPEQARALIRQLRSIAAIGQVHRPVEVDALAAVERAGCWGGFDILGRLGGGSCGVTYRALDTRLDREVALKLLPDEPGQVERGTQVHEARLLARVDHPNVVAVYSADRANGCTGIAMELVVGRTLEDILADVGPLPPDDVTSIGKDLCRALAAVHAAGVIHRDVKAHNVLRSPSGRVVLMDFGTGRESAGSAPAGDAAGTPLYLAPELLRGAPASARSDLYSLGVLLYRLSTGGYPVSAGSLTELRDLHAGGQRRSLAAARPGLPPQFVAVIERALATEEGERYATAAEMESALESLGSARARVRRVRPVLALALLLAAAVGAWRASLPPPKLPFAERQWVLVGDIENSTGEPLLEGTLRFALERELANAPTLNVVPRERIEDTLRLMRRPADTRVDPLIAREVAVRDGGIRAVVTGRAERLGRAYLLTTAVMDPASGAVTGTQHEEVDSAEGFLAAVQRGSVRMREMLGDEPDLTVPATARLEHVTTASLRALQLYSHGMALMSRDAPEFAPAADLFVQAAREDPDLAMAHLLLAYALSNLERPGDEVASHAERAMLLLPGTATEYEASFVRGGYHELLGALYAEPITGMTAEKAREHALNAEKAFAVLFAQRRDDYWAASKLSDARQALHRHPGAELLARIADVRPSSLYAQVRGAGGWLGRGDVGRGAPYLARARTLTASGLPDENALELAWLELVPAWQAWLAGDVLRAESLAHEVASKLGERTGAERDTLAVRLGDLYVTLGQMDRAELLFSTLPDGVPRYDGPTKSVLLNFVAVERGDPVRIRHRAASKRGDAGAATLHLRAGFLDEARVAISRAPFKDHPYWEMVKGELALAERRDEDALSHFRRYLDITGSPEPLSPSHRFRAWSGMAYALERKGDLAQAIRMLEEASAGRAWACRPDAFSAASEWLRARARLSALYRQAGREQEAAAVEDELRVLRSRADPDAELSRPFPD